MRPFTIGDVLCAARYLLLFEPPSRHAAARSLVQRATAADRWRGQRGRAHRCWGNGTLMAAAGLAPLPPTPPLGDPGFLDALCVMLGSLRDAAPQPDAQEMQRRAVGSSSSRRAAISSSHSSQ